MGEKVKSSSVNGDVFLITRKREKEKRMTAIDRVTPAPVCMIDDPDLLRVFKSCCERRGGTLLFF